jgi:tRNA threonylcarbamoyl adenosine modification protein YeaZ
MKTVLAIDTSTDVSYLALQLNSGEIIQKNSTTGQHDTELASLTKNLFDEAGVELSTVDEVIIGAGPGSFTGLRVGFSFAEGVATGLGKFLIAVPSFFGYAMEQESERIITIADARRSELFYAVYQNQNGEIEEIEAPTIVSISGFEKKYFEYSRTHKTVVVATGESCCEVEFIRPKHIARNLIAVSASEIGDLYRKDEPKLLYLRKVAAKTIAEREAEKSLKY